MTYQLQQFTRLSKKSSPHFPPSFSAPKFRLFTRYSTAYPVIFWQLILIVTAHPPCLSLSPLSRFFPWPTFRPQFCAGLSRYLPAYQVNIWGLKGGHVELDKTWLTRRLLVGYLWFTRGLHTTYLNLPTAYSTSMPTSKEVLEYRPMNRTAQERIW